MWAIASLSAIVAARMEMDRFEDEEADEEEDAREGEGEDDIAT